MHRLFRASSLALFCSLWLLSAIVLADEIMLPLEVQSDSGRALLEIRAFDAPLIHTTTLATGLGTPSPLLDRGDTGDSALVVFERHGDKVLLIRENPAYRAISDDAALLESVRESFPRSVLAALPIEEERGDGALVDITDFVLSDVYGVAARLQAAELGSVSHRDGTTHVIFEPLDFIARLAALVPPPRLNLTRFHGVFAPNSLYRARITPARRGRGTKPTKSAQTEDRTPAEQRSAMRWAQRLKRVFKVDVETCPNCGGTVKVIASIEDPPVIERILKHLASKDLPGLWPESRAPPVEQGRLLH